MRSGRSKRGIAGCTSAVTAREYINARALLGEKDEEEETLHA